MLPLGPDELLSTTRAVRTRLDLSRSVDAADIRACVDMALQAPSGSNATKAHFVVVTDADRRRELGVIYRECFELYKASPMYIGAIRKDSVDEQRQQERSARSADFLAEHLGDVPAIVIAGVEGRSDGMPGVVAASLLGSVIPGMWSFMLAARARGLGTCWTTLHLMQEERVADLLGIPYAQVQQVCLTPLAHTVGTDFRPASRPPADTAIHWDRW